MHNHPFFGLFSSQEKMSLAECALSTVFETKSIVARMGDKADKFYFIDSGLVAIGSIIDRERYSILQTLQAGDILGWSWISDSSRWAFDVMALQPTQALVFDASCVLQRCEENPRMGYILMRCLAAALAERVTSARLRLLDLYNAERR